MELLKTAIFILIIASVQNMIEAIIEPRKILHIPEKIIGGMIDIVQSHKNKPSVVSQQGQLQAYQGYPYQYAPWYNAYPTIVYAQNQLQNQGHYGNYVSYPPTSAQVHPSQQGYQGSQVQTQVQTQTYPQNQSGNQFQVQNQQNLNFQQSPLALQNYPAQQLQLQNHNQQTAQVVVNQIPVLGQNQQSGQFAINQVPGQGHNQQSGQFAVNQGQIQGQNQQSGQFTVNQVPVHGQNQQPGQFVVNQGQIQGQNQQSGQFSLNQGHSQSHGQVQTGQFTGLNTQTGSFVNESQLGQYGQFSGQNANFQGGNGQSGGFQVSSSQPAGLGPTCVCQAWTKPQAKGTNAIGKSEETTEIPE